MLTNYRNHAVPVQLAVAATRIRQLTWQFTMPNWCPNWVSMPTTWASRLNSKLSTTPVQRISWSKFKTQSFQPHLPWRVSSALSPVALLFPMMPQTKTPLESQPLPGNYAFRDLLATSHTTKSIVECSQSGEDMKCIDNHRLQEYTAQLWKRACWMVNLSFS